MTSVPIWFAGLTSQSLQEAPQAFLVASVAHGEACENMELDC